MPGEFYLLDNAGNRRIIDRYEPDVGKKTLGVCLSMDGTDSAQFDSLLAEAKKFASQIRSSSIEHNAAFYTLQSSFMKTIEYCLPVTQLLSKQWNKIMSPVMRAALPKCGYGATIPITVCYGPFRKGGIGIHHPFYLEGVIQLCTLVQEIVCQSQTGDLLRTSAEDLRLEIGYNYSMDDLDYTVIQPYISPTLLSTLISFVHQSGLQIIDDIAPLKTLRQHDNFLMLWFIQAGYKGLELCKLNFVQMQLSAITIADIATADGKRISAVAWKCRQGNGLREQILWPGLEEVVPPSWIELWKTALQFSLCQQYLVQNDHMLLDMPLGDWYDENILDNWKAFFDPHTNTLYVKENSKWQPHIQHGRARPPQYFANHLAVNNLPATANAAANICPAVNVTHGPCYSKDNFDTKFFYVPEPINPLEYNPASDKTLTDIEQVFELHCIAEKFLLDLCSLPADKCLSIAEGICNGTCRAVSDGSFNLQRDCTGTAAFTVHASAEDNDPLTGTNWTTGTKADQGSYRSELGGVIAVLITVDIIVQFFCITSGKITIKFDNEAAVDQAGGDWPLNVRQECFNYLQEIRNCIKLLPIDVDIGWVKGHKKGKKTWWHLRNNFCDLKAKEYLQDCTSGPLERRKKHKTPRLFYEKWALYFHGVKQSSLDKEDMYTVVFGNSLRDPGAISLLDYWRDHHDMPIPDCDDVDWETFHDVRRQLSMGINRWISKFWSGHIGVGNMLRHRGWQESDACPLCRHRNEKSSHVLKCPNNEATELFLHKVDNELKTLQKESTCPNLQEIILEILKSHCCGLRPEFTVAYTNPELKDAIRAQQKIGWDNFVLGRWSPLWQTVQARYLLIFENQRSPRRWAIEIIKKMTIITWDMWQFCNGIVHSAAGPDAIAQHAQLDREIGEEFDEETDTLFPSDRHFLRNYSPYQVRLLDLVTKQNWVASVQAARCAFVQAGQPARTTTLHRYFQQSSQRRCIA